MQREQVYTYIAQKCGLAFKLYDNVTMTHLELKKYNIINVLAFSISLFSHMYRRGDTVCCIVHLTLSSLRLVSGS